MSAVEDPAMEGEMDDQMDDMEGHDPDADENGMDEEDEDAEGEGEGAQYQKKELFAGPWDSASLK